MFATLTSLSVVAVEIDIEIGNVESDEGSIRISLVDEANFLKQKEAQYVAVGEVAASTRVDGVVFLTLRAIPEGTYALQIIHDRDDNGTLNFSFLGTPKEPLVFSNDVKVRLRPPRWDEAKFEVRGERVSHRVSFR